MLLKIPNKHGLKKTPQQLTTAETLFAAPEVKQPTGHGPMESSISPKTTIQREIVATYMLSEPEGLSLFCYSPMHPLQIIILNQINN